MGVSDSLRGTWEHRRDLGGLWWRFLARLGLSKDRFHAWKPWQQRAGKVALAGVLAFLLSMFVNTLEHFFGSTKGSILTFDLSAYVVFAVIALIVIPEWGRSRISSFAWSCRWRPSPLSPPPRSSGSRPTARATR